MTDVISLQTLRKDYGSVVAVEGVDLEVAEGELIVLLGPSGCGKSTTLRMVAGLETITSGRLLIGGRDGRKEVGQPQGGGPRKTRA